jgi:hypothetical protein
VNKPPEIPGGGTPPPKPPDTTVPAGAPPVTKPPEIPGGGTPPPKPPDGTTTPSGAPVSKPPEIPGGSTPPPKPPDPAPAGGPAAKPPTTQPPKWSVQDIKDFATKIKNGRKDGMEQLGKVGDSKLQAKLTGPPYNKTPQEAADITRWVKNFEELAAPGGTVNIGGKAFATGTLLHLAHELWKEMAPDVASREENKEFLGDLKDYNKKN